MTLGEVRINKRAREYTGHRTGERGKRMQAKEGGQNFLHGALILAASALIVKLIGAFFKVPLANIIGGSGMGYFMTPRASSAASDVYKRQPMTSSIRCVLWQ